MPPIRRAVPVRTHAFFSQWNGDSDMKTQGGSADAKRRAGESAADLVVDGTVVGLGTGTTAAWA
ncbi:MAG: hypothetical protein ACOCSN_06655, partial [Halanaeroarchaeum sp.]